MRECRPGPVHVNDGVPEQALLRSRPAVAASETMDAAPARRAPLHVLIDVDVTGTPTEKPRNPRVSFRGKSVWDE
jgi:hypothetical protein